MKILILTILVVIVPVRSTPPPIVELPTLGKIQGSFKQSLQGRTFYSFEGVPYAQPPVGENRFKEPLPPQPWVGILQAQTIYACMQYSQYPPSRDDPVIGDEDCLYLNIYTPSLDQNAGLDVVVYIHGGAFMFSWGGRYGPDYILDRNVVYINLNYRLGPLGFLSTENDLVPGNNGMKDQILALGFIQKYVKYFGGNPNSVTITGMSAGGASVHFHYLSPKSRNLFHRGISQSGCMLNPWVLMEQPLEKTKKLASVVGCPNHDTAIMVECLKTRHGRQIVGAVKHFQHWLYIPFSPFGLVVDSWSSNPILPQHPYKMITNKSVYDVPWIVSYTNSEGLYPAVDFYTEDKYINDLDTRWNELMPYILDYNYTVDPELHNEISEKIRKYYLGDDKITRNNFHKLVTIISDRIFLTGLQKAARLQSSVTNSPIYSYYFTYRGAHSFSEDSGSSEDFGACHGDDTAYVFKMKVLDTTTEEDDRAMIELFVNLVTSFAHTGKPQVPIEWLPVSKNLDDPFTFLQVDTPNHISMGEGISPNTHFWESLSIVENEKLYSKSRKDEL